MSDQNTPGGDPPGSPNPGGADYQAQIAAALNEFRGTMLTEMNRTVRAVLQNEGITALPGRLTALEAQGASPPEPAPAPGKQPANALEQRMQRLEAENAELKQAHAKSAEQLRESNLLSDLRKHVDASTLIRQDARDQAVKLIRGELEYDETTGTHVGIVERDGLKVPTPIGEFVNHYAKAVKFWRPDPRPGSGAGDGNGSPLAGPAELTQDAAAQLSHKDQLAAYHKTMGTQPTEEGADPFAALQ